MDKTTRETLIAVIFGVILGILTASLFWFIKSHQFNFKPLSKTQMTITPTPTFMPNALTLEILRPQNLSIINTPTTTLSGRTKPHAYVVISDGTSDEVLKSDASGDFEKVLKLNEGLNVINIMPVSDQGETIQRQLNLVYEAKP